MADGSVLTTNKIKQFSYITNVYADIAKSFSPQYILLETNTLLYIEISNLSICNDEPQHSNRKIKEMEYTEVIYTLDLNLEDNVETDNIINQEPLTVTQGYKQETVRSGDFVDKMKIPMSEKSL
ncbi:hypothetical protein CDIK_0832 [Cucumispora dikerogammari]|nr:hypothetical protein CDIK_0832 [Cucumispora dikerogammari]